MIEFIWMTFLVGLVWFYNWRIRQLRERLEAADLNLHEAADACRMAREELEQGRLIIAAEREQLELTVDQFIDLWNAGKIEDAIALFERNGVQ